MRAVFMKCLLAVVAAGMLVWVAPASAKTPAADCQPYDGKPCLLPYPDNRLTKADKQSVTGLRVNLPAAAMPVNTQGVRVRPGPWDGTDGFSPGSAIIVHISGLDNATALKRTGAVPLTDMARYRTKRQPVVVIDQKTGRRQLIWAEMDANAKGAANTDLVIHPGRSLTEGHTYIVALRFLKTAKGKAIKSPTWFAHLRDGAKLRGPLRAQRSRYHGIFRALHKARIATDASLYEAWSFTVDSRRSLTGRMLAIRNNAFAQLGDTNLADSVAQGRAPAFTVTDTKPVTATDTGATLTQVDGTFQVPCYLTVCGPAATGGLHLGSGGLYPTPSQLPGNVATANFECIIPPSASAANPARISLYGHGLLLDRTQISDPNVQDMSTEHNMVFCATDFWGLSTGDTLNDAAALGDLNRFPAIVDRLQQGALNNLYLGRLLLNPAGLATSPAFRPGGAGADIETTTLYYDGNSQGGIMGGFLTAIAPDWTHAVLGVTGMDYANLLVQRSIDFVPFGAILYKAYGDASLHPLILDLLQQLWDRGDPDGYATQMTDHPLPDTPAHKVLMMLSYGDFQVPMYAGVVEARTVGVSAYEPALSPDRTRDRNLFYGLPRIGAFPFAGSAVEIWDSGPGRVQPPPVSDTVPVAAANNIDPHEDVRNTPLARQQKSDFLQPSGAITDACGGQPCHTSVFTP